MASPTGASPVNHSPTVPDTHFNSQPRKGYESAADEGEVPLVLGEGEERDADVAEDEVLREKVDELEEVLGAHPGLVREVVVGVVGLADAAEQNRHDTCTNYTVNASLMFM